MRGTADYGIMSNGEYSDSSNMGYVDANYVRDLNDKRSTIDNVFTLSEDLFVEVYVVIPSYIIYH